MTATEVDKKLPKCRISVLPHRTPWSKGGMTPRFFVLKPEGQKRFGTRWAYADVLDPHITGEPATLVSARCAIAR
jgi:hypothetical protein